MYIYIYIYILDYKDLNEIKCKERYYLFLNKCICVGGEGRKKKTFVIENIFKSKIRLYFLLALMHCGYLCQDKLLKIKEYSVRRISRFFILKYKG